MTMSMWKSEVKFQDERARIYLGSPSVIRLADGDLVATHDFFGRYAKNLDGENGLTAVYRSEDDGVSWQQVTFLDGAFWGNLFLCGGALYHIGNAWEYGHVVIRRSDDGGFTWTNPMDEHTGLLLRAGPRWQSPNYQVTGAVNIIRGRVCLAVEDMLPVDHWEPEMFEEAVISAPADADLLEASSWLCSNKVHFERDKVAPALRRDKIGWLEGNVLETPDGRLVDIARVHLAEPNKAALFNLSDDFATLSFNYGTGFIDMIGGHSKFEVRRDEETGLYLTLTNEFTGQGFHPSLAARNKLALAASADLRHWRKIKTILKDESGLPEDVSMRLTGFQYVDWRFDGDDIIFLCRTAYRGAHGFHDSNRITYHVIQKFRSLLQGECQ